MNGLIVALAGAVFLLYVCVIFIIGSKLQDLCPRFPVALPWFWSMFMLLVLPVAIYVQLSMH